MKEVTLSTVGQLRQMLATMPDDATVWLHDGAQPGIQLIDTMDEEIAFVTVNALTTIDVA